jgi:anaerobic ribonucleoside-triphosphate reductase activating protein
VQGCSLDCPGCFNPETHDFQGGESIPVDALFRRVVGLGDSVEGVTVSGGEPLQQSQAIGTFLYRVRVKTSLSVVLFSGFTWDEIRLMPRLNSDIISHVDVLIAGRYKETRRLAQDLRGSVNKTVHFISDRYHPEDFENIAAGEVIIDRCGEIVCSGIDPLRWK